MPVLNGMIKSGSRADGGLKVVVYPLYAAGKCVSESQLDLFRHLITSAILDATDDAISGNIRFEVLIGGKSYGTGGVEFWCRFFSDNLSTALKGYSVKAEDILNEVGETFLKHTNLNNNANYNGLFEFDVSYECSLTSLDIIWRLG